MDQSRLTRLAQKIKRNEKRIEECLKEAEILEAENYSLQEEIDNDGY